MNGERRQHGAHGGVTYQEESQHLGRAKAIAGTEHPECGLVNSDITGPRLIGGAVNWDWQYEGALRVVRILFAREIGLHVQTVLHFEHNGRRFGIELIHHLLRRELLRVHVVEHGRDDRIDEEHRRVVLKGDLVCGPVIVVLPRLL